jgi:protein-disulfide isomerase
MSHEKNLTRISQVGLLFLGLLIGGGIMNFLGKQSSDSSANLASSACSLGGATEEETPLLTIGNQSFYYDQLDANTKGMLYDIRSESHEKTIALLKEFAVRYKLAKDKPDTKDLLESTGELPKLDELLQVPDPSNEMIQGFYQANKSMIPPNVSFEQIKPQLTRYLKTEMLQEAMRSHVQQLESKKELLLRVPEPPQPVVFLNFMKDYPAEGNPDAPHHIFALTGSFCPVCRSVAKEMKDTTKRLTSIKLTSVILTGSTRSDLINYHLAKTGWCVAQTDPENYLNYIDATYQLPQTAQETENPNPEMEFKNTALGVAKEVLSQKQLSKVSECYESEKAHQAIEAQIDELDTKGVKLLMPSFFLEGRRFFLKQQASVLETFKQEVSKQKLITQAQHKNSSTASDQL